MIRHASIVDPGAFVPLEFQASAGVVVAGGFSYILVRQLTNILVGRCLRRLRKATYVKP